ncbi:MAG: leucine-rich repeat domain-containing protein [Clostridiales bacterium]|nr:leucine-rich repeat domain-containing protein [Clostridiales bacterium]
MGKKKTLSANLALIVVLITALIFNSVTVFADDPSENGEGETGNGITWVLNEGTLTIRGTGAMDSFTSPSVVPWAADKANITAVVIEDGVTSIGQHAFEDCANLSSINIADSVTTIGYCAFKKCSSLTSVALPAGITTIDSQLFYESGLTSIDLSGVANLTSIPSSTFYGCASLETITLPASISSIEESAFYGCSSLQSITIPENVKGIGTNAFSYCTSLSTVSLSEGLETIGYGAFHGCTALGSISLPSTLKSIGVEAFYLSGLTGITIPAGVTSLGERAFYGSKLTSVTIAMTKQNPDDQLYIGMSAFNSCEDLKTVNITGNITSLAMYMFANCPKLESVSIPNTVTDIYEYAFSGCKSLKGVTLPSQLTTIGAHSFESCKGITSITIPSTVTTIGDSAFAQSGLTAITIPGSVREIGEYAFSYCDNLKSVEILDGVTTIDENAFADCSVLETVIIPGSVTIVESGAFASCISLKTIYCYDTTMQSYLENAYPDVDIELVLGGTLSAFVLGHSLSLSADICLNFFVYLPKTYTSSNTTVTFTWGDASANYSKSATGTLVSIDEHGANYKVSCGVAARCMNDTITMVISSGDQELVRDEYSIVQYINLLGNSNNDEDLHYLLSAMAWYGHYTQKYFDYREDDLTAYACKKLNADCLKKVENDIWGTFSLTPEDDKLTIKNVGHDNNNFGITYYAASVLCQTQTKMRFYFTFDPSVTLEQLNASLNVTCKGQQLQFKQKILNGKDVVYIDTPGLFAGELEDAIIISINGNEYSYDYKDYMTRMTTRSSDFIPVARSLYEFSHYANEYASKAKKGG